MPQIQLGENDILLDESLSADGTYSGISEEGTAGESLSFGEPCFLDVTDSKWKKASTSLSVDKKLAFCILTAGTDEKSKFLLSGKIRSSSFPTLTVGAPVYLSGTAGEVTTTLSTAVRVLGYGNTADELYFVDDSYLDLSSKKNNHGLVGTGLLTNIAYEDDPNDSTKKNIYFDNPSYWMSGVYHATTTNNDLVVLDNPTANTLYYVYIDSSNVYQVSLTAPDYSTEISLFTVIWNGVDESSNDLYLQTDTRTFDALTGDPGLNFIDVILLEYPSLSSPSAFQIQSGTVRRQGVNQTVASTTYCTHWWGLLGAGQGNNTITFENFQDGYIAHTIGTDVCYYSTYTNAFVTMDSANYKYACTWVYVSSTLGTYKSYPNLSQEYNFNFIPTCIDDGNIYINGYTYEDALNEKPPNLEFAPMNTEWKLIYKIIYRYDGQAVKIEDLRSSPSLPNGNPSITNSSTVSYNPLLVDQGALPIEDYYNPLESTSVDAAISECSNICVKRIDTTTQMRTNRTYINNGDSSTTYTYLMPDVNGLNVPGGFKTGQRISIIGAADAASATFWEIQLGGHLVNEINGVYATTSITSTDENSTLELLCVNADGQLWVVVNSHGGLTFV